MKNFIKENWFKLCALILITISICAVVYYFFGYIPTQDTNHQSTQQANNTQTAVFDLQAKCTQGARDFVATNDPTAGYANAYSEKYSKCFVELEHNNQNNQVGGYNYTADVWDLYAGPSGRIYAQISIYLPKGVGEYNYSAGTVEECFVGEAHCTSYGQFNSLVKTTYSIDSGF